MIKIYTAQNPIEAHLLKGFLENHDIPASVQGEDLYAIRGGIQMTPDTLPSVWILEDVHLEQAKELVVEFFDQV